MTDPSYQHKRRLIRYSMGGIVIAALFMTALIQGMNSTVFFYTPQEVLAAPQQFQDKTIRIGALVTPQSTHWNADTLLLEFSITEDGKQTIPVSFAGPKPDLYREGQGVVVEGRLEANGTFFAETLLVKHSEAYEVQEDPYSKQSLYRTLEK